MKTPILFALALLLSALGSGCATTRVVDMQGADVPMVGQYPSIRLDPRSAEIVTDAAIGVAIRRYQAGREFAAVFTGGQDAKAELSIVTTGMEISPMAMTYRFDARCILRIGTQKYPISGSGSGLVMLSDRKAATKAVRDCIAEIAAQAQQLSAQDAH